MVGRLAVLPMVGLFVMGALAGCLGDGKGGGGSLGDGDEGGNEGGGEAVFTQTTGAITGYVLDVAFAPLAGATVSLTQDGKAVRNVTSDDTGGYAVSEIEPGAYLLFANKTGYRPKSKPVTVAEGTLLREQFLLEEAPNVTPFTDGPIEFKGFLECAVAPPGGKCQGSGEVGNHRPSDNYAIKDGLQALLFEMTWKTSSGVAVNDGAVGGTGGMSLSLAWDSNDGDGSAATSSINGQTMTVYLERRIDTDGKWRIFCDAGCQGSAAATAQDDWPMTAGGTVSYTGGPNAPNLIAQRDFTIWVSAFYHQMKPDGYTGLPEV